MGPCGLRLPRVGPRVPGILRFPVGGAPLPGGPRRHRACAQGHEEYPLTRREIAAERSGRLIIWPYPPAPEGDRAAAPSGLRWIPIRSPGIPMGSRGCGRRRRDLNPRGAMHPYLLSREAHSTGLCDVSSADHFRTLRRPARGTGRVICGRPRRAGDSNPRCHCWHSGFQDRLLRPLGQPSRRLDPTGRRAGAGTPPPPRPARRCGACAETHRCWAGAETRRCGAGGRGVP